MHPFQDATPHMTDDPTQDDGEALLAGIEADPADDALRLVYADWLEEYGNEAQRRQAELIRVQIDLILSGEAVSRQNQLERLVRADQLGTAAKMSVTFDRGFIATVMLSTETFLSAAPRLAAVRPLPLISATDVGPHLHQLAACPWRDILAGVSVQQHGRPYRSGIDADWVAGFDEAGPWTRLRHLDLSETQIYNAGVRTTVDSPRLPALASLDLSHCGANRHILRYLTRSALWTRLRELRWRGNDTGLEGAEALLAAAPRSGPMRIDVRSCGIAPEQARLLRLAYGDRIHVD